MSRRYPEGLPYSARRTTPTDQERMTAPRPATALPWVGRHQYVSGDNLVIAQMDRGDFKCRELDAAYIAHAANAYPALVAALRVAVMEEMSVADGDMPAWARSAEALLRSLGEEV